MLGWVEEYLLGKIKENGALHMTLIDPEDESCESACFLAGQAELNGSSAIMVGGTTFVSSEHLDKIVRAIKGVVKVPVVLFPNNITGISRFADAIWFMSLLNSSDPYFIIGAQVLAAPLIRKFDLESIPLGYIIIGEGGAAGVIGKACPIPYNKPELAVAHALAAQYLGMHFVYLEAGSGVSRPVPGEMVRMVKDVVSVPVIVGGGIRDGEQASKVVYAGADMVVTGTALEESERDCVGGKLEGIVEGVREGFRGRIKG